MVLLFPQMLGLETSIQPLYCFIVRDDGINVPLDPTQNDNVNKQTMDGLEFGLNCTYEHIVLSISLLLHHDWRSLGAENAKSTKPGRCESCCNTRKSKHPMHSRVVYFCRGFGISKHDQHQHHALFITSTASNTFNYVFITLSSRK
jgi:hypothetical protein